MQPHSITLSTNGGPGGIDAVTASRRDRIRAVTLCYRKGLKTPPRAAFGSFRRVERNSA